ncbi:metallocarboxypeptidase [Aureococcus anophagefferens]|nr:metallocarboxypeptidase [Aureococcus anophagefferens]
MNPDGFEHSRTVDAMYRTNRNVAYAEARWCRTRYGVDLNRNFDGFGSWGQTGVSRDACSSQQAFPGGGAFGARVRGLRTG